MPRPHTTPIPAAHGPRALEGALQRHPPGLQGQSEARRQARRDLVTAHVCLDRLSADLSLRVLQNEQGMCPRTEVLA